MSKLPTAVDQPRYEAGEKVANGALRVKKHIGNRNISGTMGGVKKAWKYLSYITLTLLF